MIRCIFYSEFDNIVGPKITYQVPQSYISNEVFDAISEYFITKPQLAGRDVITLNAFGYTIMGFPMGIEGRKYHRNALLWNLAFVFESATSPSLCAANLMQRTSPSRYTSLYCASWATSFAH